MIFKIGYMKLSYGSVWQILIRKSKNQQSIFPLMKI